MEPSSKKKTIQSVLGTVAGAILVFAIQQYFFKPMSFDKAMMQAASELNKSCPLMVDSETQLDNAVALPDNIFQYNYTLVNYTKEQLDIETVKANLEPGIINNVRTNPDLKSYRENNVTMAYNYKDKNKEFLFKILVKPEQYN